jgi:hypothetical protein
MAPGFLRVVSPADLNARDAADLAQRSAVNRPPVNYDLAHFVRGRWDAMRNHRNTGHNPLNMRLLRAQRMFEGQYEPEKLVEIRKFGGSEVYARTVAVKCRGATSLLRSVYLGVERPWSLDPQADPPVPPEVMTSITTLMASTAAQMQQAGMPMPPMEQARQTYVELVRQAQQRAERVAIQQAEAASDKMDDILEAGGFYDALAEFLMDISLYPFACIKGPVVRMVPKLTWIQKQPSVQVVPQLFWERVDPFNLYWDPGATDVEHAELIERKRLTRGDLNDVLGLPGYNDDAIRGALEDYQRGLRDWMDSPDTESALNAGRESPQQNQSQKIDAIEYHGNIQGKVLLDNGVDARQVPDPDKDYLVQTWIVGRHTIKTQLSPSPRQRHPYYITSFEKVPGTIAGHGLPDILEDLQEVSNATLRALVNNLSIASGPQVVINTELLDPTVNEDQLYPWKRWKVMSDPLGSNRDPVSFFQPQSNAQELIAIYQAINNLSDDVSAIPRYVTGESLSGGAGRTASGLSMLMGNAQKVLQTVAANIDIDVIRGLLSALYDMIMLTDQSGLLSGEEQIQVNGVTVAIQKDTEHQKQLQFLQITANPMDFSIIGKIGRGKVLRSIATDLIKDEDVVPSDDDLQKLDAEDKQQAAAMQQMAMMKQAGAPGASPPGGPSAAPGAAPAVAAPGGPASPAAQAQGNQAPTPVAPSLATMAPPVNTVSPRTY